jgi:hypothetical protein
MQNTVFLSCSDKTRSAQLGMHCQDPIIHELIYMLHGLWVDAALIAGVGDGQKVSRV